MQEDRTQISAFIARETKSRLEAYTTRTGTKKGAVIEDALKAYLDERADLPAEYVIPAEVALSQEALGRVIDSIESPGEPPEALRALMTARRASS